MDGLYIIKKIYFFSFLCMGNKDDVKDGGRKLFRITRKRIDNLIQKIKKSLKKSKSKKCR